MEKRVVTFAFLSLIEDTLAWEFQLVVGSSKNQFSCEALNDWIQDEQHENMNEVIHLDPRSTPEEESYVGYPRFAPNQALPQV